MGPTHPTQLSNIPTTQMRGPMGHGRGDTPTPWGSLKVRGLALPILQPAQVSAQALRQGGELRPLLSPCTAPAKELWAKTEPRRPSLRAALRGLHCRTGKPPSAAEGGQYE